MPKIESSGRHDVTVKSAEFGETEKKTPYLYMAFENAAGEYIGGWLYLSEAAFSNSLKTLRDAFKFDGNFETAVAQVTGKACAITVDEEEFEGKPRLKVKWINAVRTSKPIEGQGAFLKNLTAQAARVPIAEPKKAASTVTKAPAKPASEFPEDVPY